MAVLAPALVKTAVVNEPMLVISGMKVLMIAPNSMGTTIIPAGIFFRNRMIMVFLPPQLIFSGYGKPHSCPLQPRPQAAANHDAAFWDA